MFKLTDHRMITNSVITSHYMSQIQLQQPCKAPITFYL